ncbi:helix-turn-helix transcriptional regulator [Nocardiopsis sp. NPDC050513]|uniref:helix-turn-helix transcriptional regulator n=1 Tax=Nocardiopsis sp. NPDC050513 TaxID=3364338 RepID=UPI0037B691D0
MVRTDTEISQFLKTRRSALSPREVGLPEGVNRRRVRGLRREEVALLAGVSVDYYTRIEQGRGNGVSASVLDAVADALLLTGDERAYLHNLAGRTPHRTGGADGACVPPAVPRQAVRPELRQLIGAMDRVPAVVLGRGLDVLAWNRLLARLWPGLDDLPDEELNLARSVFRDDWTSALHDDLASIRRDVVAKLRADTGRDPEEPRLCAVVMDLRRENAHFEELWQAREVRERPHGTHRLRHPWVGELTLDFEKTVLPADDGQVLMTYSAAPGSVSEERLALLASARHEPATA